MTSSETNSNDHSCGGCAPVESAITRIGSRLIDHDYTVALAGNPNTGKSTIFNNLTGLRQHVGNWAGKTVARAEGFFDFRDKTYKVVDLPGTYSLLSTSIDEEIARDFILFGKPDVTVIVADATRIERNLHLVLQILEITDRAVVALNLIDEAGRSGIRIDEKLLTEELGVPVIPMAARRGEGVQKLIRAISETAQNPAPAQSRHINFLDESLEKAVETLSRQLREMFGNLPNARWVALRLLEGDESIIEAVRHKKLGGGSAQSAGGGNFSRLAEAG